MNATAVIISAILGALAGGTLVSVVHRAKQKDVQTPKEEPAKKPEALTITEYASNFWVNRDVLRNRVNRAKIVPVEVVRTSNGSYARAFAVSELHKIAETMGKTRQVSMTEPQQTVDVGEPQQTADVDEPKPELSAHDKMQRRIQVAQKYDMDLSDYAHCPSVRCKGREICKSCLRNPLNFPNHPYLTTWNIPVRIEGDRCTHYQGYTASMKEAHTLYKPVEPDQDGYVGPELLFGADCENDTAEATHEDRALQG